MSESKVENLLPHLKKVELGRAAAIAAITGAIAAGYAIHKYRQVEPRILLPDFFAVQRGDKTTPPTKIEMAIVEVAAQLEHRGGTIGREELLQIGSENGYGRQMVDRVMGFLADNGLADVESVGKQRLYGSSTLLEEIAKPENADHYRIFHDRLAALQQAEREQLTENS